MTKKSVNLLRAEKTLAIAEHKVAKAEERVRQAIQAERDESEARQIYSLDFDNVQSSSPYWPSEAERAYIEGKTHLSWVILFCLEEAIQKDEE